MGAQEEKRGHNKNMSEFCASKLLFKKFKYDGTMMVVFAMNKITDFTMDDRIIV